MATIKKNTNGNIIKNTNGNISTCCCDFCEDCDQNWTFTLGSSRWQYFSISPEYLGSCLWNYEDDPEAGYSISIDVYYENGCWYATAEGVDDGEAFAYSGELCIGRCPTGTDSFELDRDSGKDLGTATMYLN